ncbi:Protein YceI [bacterium HR24]|jgi:polyisoprenoid-binding protein YceI|nr:Protein YceI [bacterium HR24]
MTTAPAPAAVSTWVIDPSHSLVEFSVRHMMVATVKGRFRTFEGTIRLDETNPENSSVEVTIDTASIDTNEPQRDAHLRSDDFLNAEKYPKITFRSKRVELLGEDRARVIGDLTIRDVTREVALDVEYLGRTRDPWGKERIGFSAQTAINRHDFGVKWNAVLDTGGVVVADTVRINLEVEAVKQD